MKGVVFVDMVECFTGWEDKYQSWNGFDQGPGIAD